MAQKLGYSTDGENVTLTMTRHDYNAVVLTLGIAAGNMAREGNALSGYLALANRLMVGNPDRTPYGIEPPKDVTP